MKDSERLLTNCSHHFNEHIHNIFYTLCGGISLIKGTGNFLRKVELIYRSVACKILDSLVDSYTHTYRSEY